MKPIFPASYSTLCPNALGILISEEYLLENVQCTFLVRGVGDTYLVQSGTSRFILRIYRSSHRSLLQIKEEVDLLLALKMGEVSVSYPITTRSGQTILTVQAAEGERHAVLFSYAPGEVIRVMTETQLRNLGSEMARFHNISSQIPDGGSRWTFDLQTTVSAPLEKLKARFTTDTEGYAWLQETAIKIKEKLAQQKEADFSKGYCHFDFLPKNFHFENDSVTFFDFDFMGYGWLVNDIMTFWQHLALDVYTNRMKEEDANTAYRHFLEGYREHRSVTDQELAMVPYLSIGFWLFYMGFHTTHDQFYAFSQPVHIKSYVGIMKHIAEKYWT